MHPLQNQVHIVAQGPSHQYTFDNTDPNSYTNPQSQEDNARYHDPQSRSSPKPRPNHVPFLDRLRALPEVRPIPWRLGQELPPEKSTDSPRVQQRGACLLATRGNIVQNPCEHCAAGLGRFTSCITLEHWFQGACSTCIFTSKGNKCSLRVETLGTTDGRKLRYASSQSEMIEIYKAQGGDKSQTSRKRKRRSAPASQAKLVDYDTSYPNTYQPPENPESSSVTYAPLESPVPSSPDLDTLLQAEIARDESPGLGEYVHQMEKKQRTQHHHSQDAGLMVDGFSREPQARESTHNAGKAEKLVVTSPQHSHPHPPTTVWSVQPTIKEAQPLLPGNVTRPDWVRGIKDEQTPVIETLPKAKQRQIYGLISGIQGGIDHLQKQLNLLRTLLGIEFEHPPKIR